MRVIDVSFHTFKERLRKAALEGNRIEKTIKEKDRWSAWVRTNSVPEAAFLAQARAACENLVPVIIDSDDEWSGFYAYSDDRVACMKYVPGR